jgi:hypothetical protein
MWAVFWQQPNAAKAMCYQLLPKQCVISYCRSRRGVAELGQNDVLLLYTLVKG